VYWINRENLVKKYYGVTQIWRFSCWGVLFWLTLY